MDRAGHQVCPGNVPGSRLGRRVPKEVAVFRIFEYLEVMPLTINWPVTRSFGRSSYEWEFVKGCSESPWKASLVVRYAPGTGQARREQRRQLRQKSVPTMRTLNDCYRHAETRREYWMAGLGLIVANRFKSGLLDIPSYRSIYIMN